jgi:hypothetical protein
MRSDCRLIFVLVRRRLGGASQGTTKLRPSLGRKPDRVENELNNETWIRILVPKLPAEASLFLVPSRRLEHANGHEDATPGAEVVCRKLQRENGQSTLQLDAGKLHVRVLVSFAATESHPRVTGTRRFVQRFGRGPLSIAATAPQLSKMYPLPGGPRALDPCTTKGIRAWRRPWRT